jgi:hypothetical protein
MKPFGWPLRAAIGSRRRLSSASRLKAAIQTEKFSTTRIAAYRQKENLRRDRWLFSTFTQGMKDSGLRSQYSASVHVQQSKTDSRLQGLVFFP